MIVDCNLFLDEIRAHAINAERLFKRRTALSLRTARLIRRLPACHGFNVNTGIFDCDDDTIIIFDGGIRDRYVLDYIATKSAARRLIFWYWNPVAVSLPPKSIPSEYAIWSYSPCDCQRYGLKYNTTFYFEGLYNDISEKVANDIFYIGRDKGRYKDIMYYKEIFDKMGLTTDFHITATHPPIDRSKPPAISYKETLRRTLASKCIFDLYKDPDAGLSLRPMESLFLKRKLITNNRKIVEYDFYRKENVFLLGSDNLNQLTEFISGEYEDVDLDIRDQYKFENWLARFGC